MNKRIIITLIITFALGAFATTQGQVSSNNAIAGSWQVIVTSNTFPEPFRALLTFDGEGGVVGSAQGDVLLSPPPDVPPVATVAHGSWTRTGNRNFLFTIRQIFYNGDGTYAGGSKVRNAVMISKSGNEMSGQLVVDYYDAADVLVFTGSGNFTATRIVPEPLVP